jgi:hypothetical protein
MINEYKTEGNGNVTFEEEKLRWILMNPLMAE